MKAPTLFIIIFLLFSFHSFAQTDLINEIKKLDREIVMKETENNKLKAEISNLKESIKKLNVSLDSVIAKEHKLSLIHI